MEIMSFYAQKYPDMTFEIALDFFENSVENYKVATKRKKLEYVAKTFINACLVASMDALTGAQAFEVFNNLATDLETDKDTLERKINKLMKMERSEYEKNRDNRTWLNLIRMCFRKASI